MFGAMVRKAHGICVQAMIGGAASVSLTVVWPTPEFAGMNIDGAVKLSARRAAAAVRLTSPWPSSDNSSSRVGVR
jgi:acetyl-CoA carboxylase carboxyltransferase component